MRTKALTRGGQAPGNGRSWIGYLPSATRVLKTATRGDHPTDTQAWLRCVRSSIGYRAPAASLPCSSRPADGLRTNVRRRRSRGWSSMPAFRFPAPHEEFPRTRPGESHRAQRDAGPQGSALRPRPPTPYRTMSRRTRTPAPRGAAPAPLAGLEIARHVASSGTGSRAAIPRFTRLRGLRPAVPFY
jgi:hypothetical protein